MPLRSGRTRARDTYDDRSLLEEEVTEETRARPLLDARSFLDTEAQEETGNTPKSGTEEAEEESWRIGALSRSPTRRPLRRT